jgi:hypothetical protein
MEEELMLKLKELMDVRNEILALKDRQQVIEASLKALQKEREDNYHKITELGEKGKGLIRELVLE